MARALVNNPAIVWGDEPTGNLDSKTASDVLALMQQLNRDLQQTFVIVTHDPAIGTACDRIINMQDGLVLTDVPENDDHDGATAAVSDATDWERSRFAQPAAGESTDAEVRP